MSKGVDTRNADVWPFVNRSTIMANFGKPREDGLDLLQNKRAEKEEEKKGYRQGRKKGIKEQ